jgi:hypothetical protein
VNAGLPVWLFVSYGAGHVKALLPVAQRVQALGLARPVYLALTAAAAAVRPTGIPVLGFRDVLQPGDSRAIAHGQRLAAQLAVQAADWDESVAYLGLSYADMEDRLGPADAAAQYARYGRQAFLPMGVLERVFAAVQPDMVVATNSPRAEQAALQVARRHGLPSVCLLDLLGIWERDLLARPDYADAVCVLNAGVRQYLIEAGRPAADVHATGNPAFDGLLAPSLKAQGETWRHDAGWDGLRVMLYASSPEPVQIPGVSGQGDPTFPRRVEQALIAAVQADLRLALWVRRHPSEAAADEIVQLDHPRIRVSPPDMPLHACIHGCDEVVVTVSTVGVEAHLAGKPVTQVLGSILDNLSPYVALGIASRACSVANLFQGWAGAWPSLAPTAMSVGQSAADRVVTVLKAVHDRHQVH